MGAPSKPCRTCQHFTRHLPPGYCGLWPRQHGTCWLNPGEGHIREPVPCHANSRGCEHHELSGEIVNCPVVFDPSTGGCKS